MCTHSVHAGVTQGQHVKYINCGSQVKKFARHSASPTALTPQESSTKNFLAIKKLCYGVGGGMNWEIGIDIHTLICIK